MKAIGIILFLLTTTMAVAQNYVPLTYSPPKEIYRKDSAQRNFFFGVSLQQYWGKFLDTNYPKPVFWKPCIGINAHMEYYPLPWIGFGIGAGVQQRGTGLINPDKNPGAANANSWQSNSNDVDSTYLERIRNTTFEMPITVLVRSPFEIIKNLRLSGSLGLVYLHTYTVQDVWISPVDGFHKKTDITDQFNRNGWGLLVSAGPEITVAKTRFQLHFVYSKSLSNIYKTNYNAKLATIGIRLSWLF